jgi:hypothetical protein
MQAADAFIRRILVLGNGVGVEGTDGCGQFDGDQFFTPEDREGNLLRCARSSCECGRCAPGKPQKWFEFWSELPANPVDQLQPFARGLALGWQSRW